MDLLEWAKLKLKEQEKLKEQIQYENLTPPKPPKIEEEQEYTSSADISIDFNRIARSSDFQRFIVGLFKTVMPEQFRSVRTRVSKEVMSNQFNTNLQNYRDVITELKGVLAKRKKEVKKNE